MTIGVAPGAVLPVLSPGSGLLSMQLDHRLGRGRSRTTETHCSLPGDQHAIRRSLAVLAGNELRGGSFMSTGCRHRPQSDIEHPGTIRTRMSPKRIST